MASINALPLVFANFFGETYDSYNQNFCKCYECPLADNILH